MIHKVLLIEDDVSISDALSMILNDHFGPRVEISCAYTGKQALEVLARSKENFAIALVDLMMPEISGYELLPELLKNPAYKTIYPIIISAVPNAAAYGLQKGVHVIKKPIHMQELIDLMEKHFQLLDKA